MITGSSAVCISNQASLSTGEMFSNWSMKIHRRSWKCRDTTNTSTTTGRIVRSRGRSRWVRWTELLVRLSSRSWEECFSNKKGRRRERMAIRSSDFVVIKIKLQLANINRIYHARLVVFWFVLDCLEILFRHKDRVDRMNTDTYIITKYSNSMKMCRMDTTATVPDWPILNRLIPNSFHLPARDRAVEKHITSATPTNKAPA